MGSRAKRLLFLAHRWLGIVLCLFFAMWFVSGVVMMYVGYPKLTEAERLHHLPPLPAKSAMLAPHTALATAGVTGPLASLRLAVASGGQPVYLAEPAGHATAGGKPPPAGRYTIVIDAYSGQRVPGADAARAMASAAAWAGGDAAASYAGAIDEDAFSHTRNLDGHRPLHRVQLADPEQTLLYISGRTGEVVRDASLHERVWNYAGAWIHWLYPLRGGSLDRYWANTVNWLAIAGCVMVLAGATAGLLRWRFRHPYRSGTRTPYPGAVMRWHHIGGLLFAVIAGTWIFSGLMSMNPWRIFDTGAAPLRMAAIEGSPLQLTERDAAPQALLAAASGSVRELRWTRVLGQTLVMAQYAQGAPVILDSHSAQTAAIDAGALQSAAQGLLEAPLLRTVMQTEYDFHYYRRDAHAMTGGSAKPLPVLRLEFGDAQQSWVYLDPHTGAMINRSDSGKRTNRWLFSLLHSWDFLPLLERRPLWDALLLVLSAGGALISLTGIVIAWRRLGRKLRQPARLPQPSRPAMAADRA
jgi:hypothetical protein